MGRGRGRGHGVRTTAALVMAAVIFTGCTPSPAPSPSPTGFASDEEAFAAAEATYRAYIDAVNQVDLSAQATFEPVFRWLRGPALEATRGSFADMRAKGWTVEGQSSISLISPSRLQHDSVSLAVCLDVSDVRLTDREGTSQVEDRPREQSIAVGVIKEQEGWVIESFAGRQGAPECKR